jgi:hypothetical protein
MNRAADLVLGGWNIGGVYSAQTGQFLTAQYRRILPAPCSLPAGLQRR